MDRALSSGQQVVIDFNGPDKIDEPGFEQLMARIENHEELWWQIHSLDTEEGRKVLATALDKELLQRRVITSTESEASNDIIEPNTIVLIAVAVVLLTLAGTASAAVVTEVRRGPCRVEVEFQAVPPIFRIKITPTQ